MRDYPSQILGKVLRNKIVRFFLVSGLNTAFGYGLFALLIFAGLHYTLAGLITTVCGVLFNFKTIGLLVFNSKRNAIIFRFFGVYAINYFISIGLLTILERSGIDASISLKFFQATSLVLFQNPRAHTCIGAAILVIPLGLFAYALHRFLVFGNPAVKKA